MKTSSWVIVLCLTLAMSISAISQTTATPNVTKRQIKQQARIQQGVKSGELTRKEAAKLELQQAKIQHDKTKAKSDGVVTPAERKQLQCEENRASKNIYRKKHNEATRTR